LYYACFVLLGLLIFCFFFFSSRRRHTRLQGDWSSDVCSSDLPDADVGGDAGPAGAVDDGAAADEEVTCVGSHGKRMAHQLDLARSEERREGKSVDLGGRRIIKKKKRKKRRKDKVKRKEK